MIENQLSLHLRKFNDRVKVLNQTNSRDLTLTAAEARQLQADIFDLLNKINELTELKKDADENAVVSVDFDGGSF